jgi:hypothetical protein
MKKGQMTGFGANLPTIMIILLVTLIILAIIINEQYKLPSTFRKKPIEGTMRDFFLFFGIPSDWLYVPAMIYLFFVPFLGIFAIVYGFLNEMDIFTKTPKVNIILALLFAFATIPIGAFVRFVSLMFAVLGFYSTGAFGLLFFFGVISVIIARMGGWGFFGQNVTTYHQLDTNRRYEQLRRWVLDMHRDYSGHPNPAIANTVAHAPVDLTRADGDWTRGRIREAINRLQVRANQIYAGLRRAGVNVRRPPR